MNKTALERQYQLGMEAALAEFEKEAGLKGLFGRAGSTVPDYKFFDKNLASRVKREKLETPDAIFGGMRGRGVPENVQRQAVEDFNKIQNFPGYRGWRQKLKDGGYF